MSISEAVVPGHSTTPVRHQDNAFDLIRVIAAFGVLFSHSFPLTGRAEPLFFGAETIGALSVFVFFTISGFLVQKSWDRRPDPVAFTLNRALRIFPGLFICLLVCAFVLGSAVVTISASFPGERWIAW